MLTPRVYNKGDIKKDKKGRTIHYTNAQLAGVAQVLLCKPTSLTAEEAIAKFEGDDSTLSTTSTSNTSSLNNANIFTVDSSANNFTFVDTTPKFGAVTPANKPAQL